MILIELLVFTLLIPHLLISRKKVTYILQTKMNAMDDGWRMDSQKTIRSPEVEQV